VLVMICSRWLSVAACIVLLVACGKPDRQARSDCEAAKRWLELAASDVARCLNNRAFRDELKARVDERFAETLTLTHNRDRGVVSPRGYDVSTFEVIETTKDLPVNMLGLAEESAVHIGKRYAIKA